MAQRLLGEGPTPVATRDPRLSYDVQTEPLEMMGGSGLVSVPLSVPDISQETSKPFEISFKNLKADPDAASSLKKITSDFPNIFDGVF